MLTFAEKVEYGKNLKTYYLSAYPMVSRFSSSKIVLNYIQDTIIEELKIEQENQVGFQNDASSLVSD